MKYNSDGNYVSIVQRYYAGHDADAWYRQVHWLHHDYGENLYLHALYCFYIG